MIISLCVILGFVKDLIKPDDAAKFNYAFSMLKNAATTESVDVGTFLTLCVEGEAGFPMYKQLEWTLTKLDSETLMLTAPKSSKGIIEETDTIITTNEFVDFFQHAPIALHWLSGTGAVSATPSCLQGVNCSPLPPPPPPPHTSSSSQVTSSGRTRRSWTSSDTPGRSTSDTR